MTKLLAIAALAYAACIHAQDPVNQVLTVPIDASLSQSPIGSLGLPSPLSVPVISSFPSVITAPFANNEAVIAGGLNDDKHDVCDECAHQYSGEKAFRARVNVQCQPQQQYIHKNNVFGESYNNKLSATPYVDVSHGTNELASDVLGVSWLWKIPSFIVQRMSARLYGGCAEQVLKVDVKCNEKHNLYVLL